MSLDNNDQLSSKQFLIYETMLRYRFFSFIVVIIFCFCLRSYARIDLDKESDVSPISEIVLENIIDNLVMAGVSPDSFSLVIDKYTFNGFYPRRVLTAFVTDRKVCDSLFRDQPCVGIYKGFEIKQAENVDAEVMFLPMLPEHDYSQFPNWAYWQYFVDKEESSSLLNFLNQRVYVYQIRVMNRIIKSKLRPYLYAKPLPHSFNNQPRYKPIPPLD